MCASAAWQRDTPWATRLWRSSTVARLTRRAFCADSIAERTPVIFWRVDSGAFAARAASWVWVHVCRASARLVRPSWSCVARSVSPWSQVVSGRCHCTQSSSAPSSHSSVGCARRMPSVLWSSSSRRALSSGSWRWTAAISRLGTPSASNVRRSASTSVARDATSSSGMAAGGGGGAACGTDALWSAASLRTTGVSSRSRTTRNSRVTIILEPPCAQPEPASAGTMIRGEPSHSEW